MRQIALFYGLIITLSVFGQQAKMRDLKDLINKNDPGWPIVKGWIDKATNKVEILPKDDKRADSALYHSQMTTDSPLGAVIYETGGILIDYGWIRILGSGSEKLDRSIMDWNKGKSFSKIGDTPSFLLVADDVFGGFFAINAGGIENKYIGEIYYREGNHKTWECIGIGYSDFLTFCFQGDLNELYDGMRWINWIDDVSKLNGNEGIPPIRSMWTKDGKYINNKPATMQELWDLSFTKTVK